MKKSLLLFMYCFGIVLNIYAQYPIPSYSVPIFPKGTFNQFGITPGSGEDGPMDKRAVGVQVLQTMPDSETNIVTIYVYNLQDSTVLGPYYVTGDSTLYVPIGDGDWGVLVESEEKVVVSVWIQDYVTLSDAGSGYSMIEPETVVKKPDKVSVLNIISSGTSKQLTSIFFPSTNIGYIAGDNGTILKTSNGGTTWINLPSSSPNNYTSIFFTDVNTGYVAGTYGPILKTINGGTKWTAIGGSKFFFGLESLYFTNSETGYVCGIGGQIFKTNDGGISWINLLTGTNNDLNLVYFINSNIGYAVGTNGIIIKTINGGTTWTTLSSGTIETLYSIYFTTVNTGFAVGGFGTILRTADGGTTWTNSQSGTNIWLGSVTFIDDNHGFVVGSDDDGTGYIYSTINGGISWIESSNTFYHLFNSICFTDVRTGYAVGGNGMILKIIEGGTNSIEENQLPESLLSIYPNPASTKMTIKDNRNLPEEATINIYNITGIQVINFKILGKDPVEIDVSSLKKGMYIVKMETDEGVESKMLVIE